MREAAAVLMALGVFLAVRGTPAARLADRLTAYLRSGSQPPTPHQGQPPDAELELRRAGLQWSREELWVSRLAAAAAGTLFGILLAQGDLFLTTPGRSLPGLAVLGAVAGLLTLRMWITTRREGRARALRQELPTVADSLALQIVAGESVATALEQFVRAATGVVAEELQEALDRYRTGSSIPEVMARAARETAHPEAGRLYQLLGHAHGSGGKLADTLGELSLDYRGGLARELTSESGRRVLATYGPILALMVPVTVVFLMYPTIVGLRQLAGGP